MVEDEIKTYSYVRDLHTYEWGETFIDVDGNTLSEERYCYIDALMREGVENIPWDVVDIFSLEALCLEAGVYVKFEDS